MQTYGTGVVSQDGREVKLVPGKFTIVDSSRPYQRASGDDLSGFVSVAFPRSLLSLRPDDIAAVTATAMPRYGAGALLSSMLAEASSRLDEFRPAEERVAGVVLDLPTTVLACRVDQQLEVPVRDRAVLARAYAFIDAHLHDPDLTRR